LIVYIGQATATTATISVAPTPSSNNNYRHFSYPSRGNPREIATRPIDLLPGNNKAALVHKHRLTNTTHVKPLPEISHIPLDDSPATLIAVAEPY
jgi:hypothetical protein